MSQKTDWARTLRNAGALFKWKGHDQPHPELTSAYHSDTYVNMSKVVENPGLLETMCEELIKKARLQDMHARNNEHICIVGQAFGSAPIAYEIARQLPQTQFVYTEKAEREMSLSRFNVERARRAIVVEDVLTTGKTTEKTIRELLSKNIPILPVVLTLVSYGRKKELTVEGNTFKIIPLVEVEAGFIKRERYCPICNDVDVAPKERSRALRPRYNWEQFINV